MSKFNLLKNIPDDIRHFIEEQFLTTRDKFLSDLALNQQIFRVISEKELEKARKETEEYEEEEKYFDHKYDLEIANRSYQEYDHEDFSLYDHEDFSLYDHEDFSLYDHEDFFINI